jgi:hypothetical protein
LPSITRSGWRVNYYWSESSGLKLGLCEYGSVPVLHNASVPFVYVNYEGDLFGPFTDVLRSESAVVDVRDIVHGFDLKVSYDAYGPDYQYDHVWRFHSDGQFGSTIVIQGPGEEIEGKHTYHVPFRVDVDVSGESGDSFQKRLASGRWSNVAREGRQRAAVDPPTPAWRLLDRTAGREALVIAGASDDAELWALRYKRAESWSSWGAVAEGEPGTPGSVPAVYDDNQSVQAADIVLWYIAHVSSAEGISACGPRFMLEGYPAPPPEEDHDGDHHHGDDQDHEGDEHDEEHEDDHEDEGGHHDDDHH